MSERIEKAKGLLERYGNDTARMLDENPELETLELFSDRRESLLDWYPFRAGEKLLLAGAGDGGLLPLLLRKGLAVTALDTDEAALAFLRERKETFRLPGELETVSGKLGAESTVLSGPFDYILFDGTLGGESAEALSAARKLLTPGGTLFIAAENAYGVRAFAGQKLGENALSYEALTADIAAEGGESFFYFPEPLKNLADTVYSERRLPEEGELSRVIPAYGFPTYVAINVGAKYNEVCRDGLYPRFADSFLACWTKGEAAPESRPVYVKYNRNRDTRYRLVTIIWEKADGTRLVEKRALSADGNAHIAAFAERLRCLREEGRDISYATPEIRTENGLTSACFPYVLGENFSQRICREIAAGAPLEDTLERALDRLIGGGEVHNIDAIFDNFLVTGGTAETEIERLPLTGIDCEWVSETALDKNYVRYRALRTFYEQQRESLGLGTEAEFLQRFGVTAAECKRFAAEEASFQRGVAGKEQARFLDRFIVSQQNAEIIARTERTLEETREQLAASWEEIRIRDAEIKKITEVKRLTDNHVVNLETMIRDLRRENGQLAETLQYLSRHQTLYSRLRRKASAIFNAKYPKGSGERKRFLFRLDAIRHPIRHRKLVSTPEGRNLIDGEFAIGDIYREHGKLSFPQFDAPRVSIIIPCYNQIAYTYACLVSILEHTPDISYEVIIADDVSTDATKRLSDFAEGLVIARNETNQGFLKNCNQAAAKARGEFLFFLNNDTKVTEGYLSWLLKLMDEDPGIGMTGSKLVYPDGRLQEAGGIIWSDASGWNYGRLQDPSLPEFNYVKDVDYMSGAAILIRHELWKEIGGFDTRYAPAYCEDSDLAFEVRAHGYRVVYQPKSVVIHFEGISNGTDVQGTGLKRYQIENTEKLKEKWKKELAEQFENNGNPDPFRARERSKGKKIILVVDHYVPTFDKDAGSRTTWQYLKMFVKQGYQVKFLGDNFAAEEPYTTALTQLGIEVLYGPAMQQGIWDWIEKHAADLDFVYLNRPHIASKYIDFIQERTSVRVLYYGHDLHFLRERREYELTRETEHRDASAYWKGVEFSLLRKAALSFYPSADECKAIHAIDKTIRVKPLTAYVWDSFPPERDFGYEKREGLLFVGGFAHPPNLDAVLWFLKEVFPRIRAEEPVNFYVAGSKVPDELKALDNPAAGIHILGFVSDERLAELYQSCRLVVVPLRYGAGVKGKVIEALYYGAPVLTTPIGAEGIPDAASVMEIREDAADFADATLRLYRDRDALTAMAERAARYIRAHNSMDAVWAELKDDFA